MAEDGGLGPSEGGAGALDNMDRAVTFRKSSGISSSQYDYERKILEGEMDKRFRKRYEFLKQVFEDQLIGLAQKFTDLKQVFQTDHILSRMKSTPVTSPFVSARQHEIALDVWDQERERQLVATTEKLSEIYHKNNALESELEYLMLDKKHLLSQAASENKALKNSLVVAKEDNTSLINRLQQMETRTAQEFARLQEESEKIRNENQELRQTTSFLRKQCDQSEQELRTHQEEAERLSNALEHSNIEREKLRKNYLNASEELERACSAENMQEHESKTLIARIDSSESRCQHYMALSQRLESKFAEYSQKLLASEETILKLEEHRDDAWKELEDRTESLNVAHRIEVEGLQEEIAQLSNEIVNLKNANGLNLAKANKAVEDAMELVHEGHHQWKTELDHRTDEFKKEIENYKLRLVRARELLASGRNNSQGSSFDFVESGQSKDTMSRQANHVMVQNDSDAFRHDVTVRDSEKSSLPNAHSHIVPLSCQRGVSNVHVDRTIVSVTSREIPLPSASQNVEISDIIHLSETSCMPKDSNSSSSQGLKLRKRSIVGALRGLAASCESLRTFVDVMLSEARRELRAFKDSFLNDLGMMRQVLSLRTASLKQKLILESKERQNLAEKNKVLLSELETCMTSFEKLTKHHDKLRNDKRGVGKAAAKNIERLEVELRAKEALLNDEKKSLEIMNRNYQDVVKQSNNLEMQIKTLNASILDWENKFLALRKENNSLASKNQDHLEQIKSLESKLVDHGNAEKAVLLSENEQRLAEVENLRQKLAHEVKTRKSVTKKLERLQSQHQEDINRLTEQSMSIHERYTHELEELQADHKEFVRKAHNEMNSLSISSEMRAARLKSRHEKLRNEYLNSTDSATLSSRKSVINSVDIKDSPMKSLADLERLMLRSSQIDSETQELLGDVLNTSFDSKTYSKSGISALDHAFPVSTSTT